MSLFEKIDSPHDLRRLDVDELPSLAGEMRERLIDTVTRTGGHLGSGLGVLDLTIALHYVHDFRRDRLVFDVGHQCYPHKMLTGRKRIMDTMRQDDGLCGFPLPSESEYDLFHTGHAGTSISLGLGLALADSLARSDRRTVVVIGDAGFGAGMAFEAMNAAGEQEVDLLVILNDNEMSISPTVGAMSRYLTRVRTGPLVTGAKRELHELIKRFPFVGEKVDRSLHETADMVRSVLRPGHVFEEYGFTYFGPLDGHDIPRLVHTLRDLKERRGLSLLHVLTRKGEGCQSAATDPQRLHGVKPRPTVPLRQDGEPDEPAGKPPPRRPAFTDVFADALVELAREDARIVGITAAMPDGTGLNKLAQVMPDRCFDVGICEQHAVGLAGGLARGGRKPVVAIYSTFLQRGYDQVFQELLIQDADVVLALDRAGLVDDGATHHGLFDIAYLRTLPGLVLMAPADEDELRAMLAFAVEYEGTVVLRYPRDAVPAATGPARPVHLGRAVRLREGQDAALVAYGTMVPVACAAADLLSQAGCEAAVVNARFAKPIDQALLAAVTRGSRLLVTLEEHAAQGGFGAAVLESLVEGEHDVPPTLRIGVPDRFIEHGTRPQLLEKLGLTPQGVAARVLAALGSPVAEAAMPG